MIQEKIDYFITVARCLEIVKSKILDVDRSFFPKDGPILGNLDSYREIMNRYYDLRNFLEKEIDLIIKP